MQAALRRIDYYRWFWRVVAWDGLLPILVITTSIIVRAHLRNYPLLVEFVAVTVPFTFFWIRARVGISQVLRNNCSQILRSVQFGLFGVAILFLVLLECLVILSPPEVLFADRNRRFIGLFSMAYLLVMIIAWYPGPKVRS